MPKLTKQTDADSEVVDVVDVVDTAPEFVVDFEKVYKKCRMSTDPHMQAFATSMGKSSAFSYKAHRVFRELYKGIRP